MSDELRNLAKTIRSKNAGVDHITFDIILNDRKTFERVRDRAGLDAASVAKLFGIDKDRISHFAAFEPANAIKFTIRRLRPSGDPGESDMFGCQQYAPLFALKIP